LSELEVEWCFRLPIAIERFANLPFQKRNWDRNRLFEFHISPDGKGSVTEVPVDLSAIEKKQRVLKKREARIVWPDELELRVPASKAAARPWALR
jgi:hypothetical protein